MFKYLFSFGILICSLGFSREYISEMNCELSYSLEFLRFLKYVKQRLVLSLTPIRSIAGEFESEILGDIGFLQRVAGGENISRAFESSVEDKKMDGEAREIMKSAFEDFGNGNIYYELERLDGSIHKLSSRCEAISEEFKKRAKITRTLSLAFALGLIILIL